MKDCWNLTWQGEGHQGLKCPRNKNLVTPPNKQLTPAEVLAKSKRNPEYVDKEDDEHQS